MKKKVDFAPWPYFGKDEIHVATRVLVSGKVNQWTGHEVFDFEREYARYLGVKHAVALANGSVALDIALLSLNIGPGDEVIVPARSFVASASCVALRKATPVFCDVDRESQDLTVKNVEKVFTKKTRAVIAVHLAGWPCELDELRSFCDKKRVYLIEDCAQAHGARYKGKPVGSFGDVACFSFCQDKILTTAGEGGMLITDNRKIWEKAWSYKDHGRNYQSMFGKKDSCGFLWTVDDFGTNYRMTEIQAAVGRTMLRKLDSWVIRRRRLADILSRGFGEFSELRVTVPPQQVYHSYYKYYVFLRPEELRSGLDRDKIVRGLHRKGIPCGTGVCPEIYRERAFARKHVHSARFIRERFPVAGELGRTSIMFQVHPTLSEESLNFVVEQMRKLLRG